NKGTFIPLRHYASINGLESLCDYVEEHGSLVCKPFDGGGGLDILIVHYDSEKGYITNGVAMSREEFIAMLKKIPQLMIACEYVRQAAYARTIYPNTTNTIRILTFIDP